MLRDFVNNPNLDTVRDVLSRFDVEMPGDIVVVQFEVITPDSFMWQLLIGKSMYYLYAEDYVSGLDYIMSVFDKYIGKSAWEFVKSKNTISFNDASPVQAASVYEEPKNSHELMRYAVDAGYDFVFLARRNGDGGAAVPEPGQYYFPG